MDVKLRIKGVETLQNELRSISMLSDEMERRLQKIRLLCDCVGLDISKDDKPAVSAPINEVINEIDNLIKNNH